MLLNVRLSLDPLLLSSTPLFRLDSPMLNWMLGIDIAPDSVTNILSRLSKQVYVTQEVVDTSGVLMNKHSNVGDVQVYVLSLLLGECAEVWGADWLNGILGLAMPTRLKTHSQAAVSRRLPILTLRVDWRVAWRMYLLRTTIPSVTDRR